MARVNVVSYSYGSCESPYDPRTGVREGSCELPLSVSSHPACEQPHSLYERYAAGGRPVPHRHIRVRGAPGAIFQDGGRPDARIEIYTGDARVLIVGADEGMVTRAADRIVAPRTSPGGARDPTAELPRPIKGAAEDNADRSPPCPR